MTKLLTPEQLSSYQPWLDNRRLRELVSELETLTIRNVQPAGDVGAETGSRSAEKSCESSRPLAPSATPTPN